MGLKFRRGTTAQKSGSLAFGEPYVNTTLGTLQIGGEAGDVTLLINSASQGISGSSLNITGNAKIDGNLTLGGAITIGDATADTVNVIASLSSSLIPQTTNAFDLGSTTKIWRDLYISTGSIKFVAGTTVVKELTLATLTALEAATGSSNVSITNLNTATASLNTSVSNLNAASSSYETKGRSIVSGSSQITYASISSIPSGIVSGSSQILGGTNIFSSSAQLPSGIVSGSTQVISLLPMSTVSGSSQVTLSSTTGYGTVINQNLLTTSNVQHNSLGIGMAASGTAGRIDASGDIVAFSTTDKNFKENITPIENPIEKIRMISGNTYDWKVDMKEFHGFEGNDVGVIAQEIEAVLPQLVTTRETGYKAVKYDKLVALLIEGMKAQQNQIDNLTIEIEKLKESKGL